MTHYPPDIRYACAQLGLPPGATLEQAQQVVANATSYKFMTRDRVAHVQRFADFFAARARISMPQDTFERIRKGYHRQAMALHPDTNKGDQKAEEKLKSIIAAYKIVEEVHKESIEYFKRPDEERAALEEQSRQQTLRETPGAPPQPEATAPQQEQARPASPPPKAEPPRAGAVKYMAASVPRYIRTSRLYYLARDAIIGSRMGGGNLMYDIIMLPEREFVRARLNLAMEGNSGQPELTMSKMTPAYIPKDTREVTVQPEEAKPHVFARAHFQKEFNLPAEGTGT